MLGWSVAILWEVAVRLDVAGIVFGGIFLCSLVSRWVSWVGSGAGLGRFLGIFPAYTKFLI